MTSPVDRSRPPGISIGQIILEEAHFAHRADYLNLSITTPMDVAKLELQVESGQAPDGKTGLVRVRVATPAESKTVYGFRVSMVALVAVDENAPNMPMERYLATSGAALLFPFVRQVIADLTLKGRFGPVWISPVNLLISRDTSGAPALPSSTERTSKRTQKTRKKRPQRRR